jgi:hypothetical protein
MTKKTNPQPVKTLRDADIKAAIWKNESENGHFPSVTFGRTFTDDKTGEVKNSDSFSGSQLLRLARLADQAYGVQNKLRREWREEAEGDEN